MKGCVSLAEKPELQAGRLQAEARQGNRAAFEKLVEAFERKVMRLAYYLTRNWHDAEDVAQEVYVKIVEKAPALETWDRLEGWVMRVTATTARDLQRRRRRWLPLPRFLGSVRPAREVEHRQFRERLNNALSTLSFTERAAFVLREMQELSTEDVASLLECRPATVRGYLLTARRKLQQRLGDWGEKL